MTQRKKFLYWGLGLNLLFYTGISVAMITLNIKEGENFLHTQLRQVLKLEEMMVWEKQRTSAQYLELFYSYALDETAMSHLGNIIGIPSVSKKEGDSILPVLLKQPSQPVPPSIFDDKKPVAVFHSVENRIMYLTFLILPDMVKSLHEPHIVTIEQPLLALPSASPTLKSDITILERNWTGVQVLRSSMSRALQDEIKSQFVFNLEAPVATEGNFEQRYERHQTMILSNEKYLVYPLYLINQKKFSQVVLYTFKIKDFVLIDNFSMAIAVLLMLCVSLGILFAAHSWSHDKE